MFSNLSNLTNHSELTLETIDLHTAGEPLRLVVSGWPPVLGDTMLEKRRYVMEHQDHLRRAIMLEPRGHENMYGCLLLPPVTEDGDFGLLFLHNEGLSSMCGHGVIAVASCLYELGSLTAKQKQEGIRFDTPAGRVLAKTHCDSPALGVKVRMTNVGSYLSSRDVRIELPNQKTVSVDIAFGGAFYAIAKMEDIGVDFSVPVHTLVEICHRIKSLIEPLHLTTHPHEHDLSFLYGVILTGPPQDAANHSRNLCVFADQEVDRSPTGTGVSARVAQLVARNEIELGQPIRIESILGSKSLFTVEAETETRIGNYSGVVPVVSGEAFVCGINRWIIDPRDPLRFGFKL